MFVYIVIFTSYWRRLSKFKLIELPGVLAHTCNPSYSVGRDQEDHGSRPAKTKSGRPHLTQWLGMVMHTCDPSYVIGINRRIMIQASLEKNGRPYSKK
jgi:hypothetical protein